MIVKSFRARKSAAEMAGGTQILTLDNPAGWLTGEDSAMTPTAAMKLSAVYGAVDYVCNFIAGLPLYIYDEDNRARVDKHHLLWMLNVRPNEAQTPVDYKRFMTRNLQLRGRAFAYIHRDPRNGHPLELIPLLSDHVRTVLEDGHLLYLYSHPTTGIIYALDPTDVLHYKWDSDDGYDGIPVLHYAARTLMTGQAASEYETAVYKNGAYPAGVLQTQADLGGDSKVKDADGKPISKKENVRRAWERVHSGTANAFRVAVLDQGLEYKAITLSPFDAQFIAARDVNVADIARFFGVPLHALMTGKQSYQSNEQNSLEFVQGKGLTLVRMMEEEDSYKLLLDTDLQKNLRVKRNMTARLRGDSKSRAEFYRVMHEIGALSVNQINALEDQPNVPGGDIHVASLNYVPLSDFERLALARNGLGKEGE